MKIPLPIFEFIVHFNSRVGKWLLEKPETLYLNDSWVSWLRGMVEESDRAIEKINAYKKALADYKGAVYVAVEKKHNDDNS
jgi:hypothetical protein